MGKGRESRGAALPEAGFSLVELLVVLIIIGLLAAIAIPRFISQQNKAHDADAKTGARLALVAMESYGVEHHGYTGADKAKLIKIEPTLSDAPGLQVLSASGDTFELITVSDSTDPVTFRAKRTDATQLSRTCTPITGGCSDGFW